MAFTKGWAVGLSPLVDLVPSYFLFVPSPPAQRFPGETLPETALGRLGGLE